MPSLDQFIAAIVFILGLAAGVLAILQPAAGVIAAILGYLKKVFGKNSQPF